MRLQRLNRKGHRQIGLSGPGRPDTEGDDVGRYGVGVLPSDRQSSGGPTARSAERRSSLVSTSDGLTSSFTIAIVRSMSEGSRRWPCSRSKTSSSNRRPTRSASSPSIVISLPRTTMSEPANASCTNRSNSSRWPSRPTIRWLPGTRIFTWVADTGDSRLPVGPGHRTT